MMASSGQSDRRDEVGSERGEAARKPHEERPAGED